MPLKRSWVESANAPGGDFPLNNLPYGVFSRNRGAPVCCVAIGDRVLDLSVLEAEGLLRISPGEAVFDLPFLNEFLECGRDTWAYVRIQLTGLLADGGDGPLQADKSLCARALLPTDNVQMHLPFVINEFTDFYSSRNHAQNVGTMFRGAEAALPPNWLHMPIGYNGRASSVVVSGTDIHRPLGQMMLPDAETPVFGPTKRLDFELELGAVVGTGSTLGQPVTVAQADAMIFGYVLLNDWSSRDIQAWEYQPLGPFQGKAFGTTISPWVVTAEALKPFRCATPKRETPLLPYLREPGPMLYDIELEVTLQPEGAQRPTTITRTNSNQMYYSAAQQLCHHSISGCEMNAGDLLGSGTISGPTRDEFGSLLELSWGGKEPLALDTGEKRSFLEDGDRLTLTGHAGGDGFRIGFGACTGRILPAIDEPDWE